MASKVKISIPEWILIKLDYDKSDLLDLAKFATINKFLIFLCNPLPSIIIIPFDISWFFLLILAKML